jgi:transposase
VRARRRTDIIHHRQGGRREVFVGVDSHKDTLATCVVDGAGREIAAATFENSPAGHAKLLRWMQVAGDIERVGVECSGTYGAGLGRFLVEQGVAAFEVPTKLSVRERRHLRRPGSRILGTRSPSPA